jgi:hypothetical protein
MPYRRSKAPDDELPDIVHASAQRAARNVALVGAAAILGGALLYATASIGVAVWTSVIAMSLGVALELYALVFWLRHR